MLLTEFAAAMGSRVENLEKDFAIRGITTLENAGPTDVSFVSDRKYLKQVKASKAGAVIVSEKLTPEGRPFIPLAEPWAGVLYLLQQLHPDWARRWYTGIHPTAVVDGSAQLAANVQVGPTAVIGPRVAIAEGTAIGPGCVIGPGCTIGSDCTLGANCVLEAGTVLGDNVILQPGAVLGADGFKYEILGGKWTKIPQVGKVIIGAGAEVGANTCIDRASFTETRVGPNTKLDNLVQIAHNANIGGNSIIVSQTGIAGSTEIGDNCILAAQVGVADNLKLGKGVIVLAQAGVKDNLEDGQTVIGSPARPFRHQARIFSVENKLPDLAAELARLTEKVAELEKRLSEK